MDWVILFLLLVVLVYQVIIMRRLDDIVRRLKMILTKLDESRTRQGNVTSRRTSEGSPKIDAKARVIRRDTMDLPVTGRISRAVKREKRDYARADADD